MDRGSYAVHLRQLPYHQLPHEQKSRSQSIRHKLRRIAQRNPLSINSSARISSPDISHRNKVAARRWPLQDLQRTAMSLPGAQGKTARQLRRRPYRRLQPLCRRHQGWRRPCLQGSDAESSIVPLPCASEAGDRTTRTLSKPAGGPREGERRFQLDESAHFRRPAVAAS